MYIKNSSHKPNLLIYVNILDIYHFLQKKKKLRFKKKKFIILA